MKIEQKMLDTKYYDGKRPCKIEYIVVQTLGDKITHYHVVNGEVLQIVPDDYMTKAINGSRLSRFGYLHGICTKYNGITIGLPEKMSEEDKQACIRLVMTLKQRYNIDSKNIIRQMDVTGELDPYVWCDTNKWEKDIKHKLIDIPLNTTNSKE